jgi:hypothetical protein
MRLLVLYLCVLAGLLVIAWVSACGILFLQLRNQLSHFSVQELETVEGLLFFTQQGELRLKEDYHNHPESKNVIERFLEVRGANGSVLYRNERLGERSLGGVPYVGEGIGGYSGRSDHLSDGTRVRMVSRVHTLGGRTLLIRLAHSEEPLYARLWDFFFTFLVALPIVILIAWIAGEATILRNLLPMCAWCKKIEHQGRWTAIEAYARDQFDTEFTHGICPECNRRLMGEYRNVPRQV